ncbi:MAG: nitrilase-related carbon-nitrogen hydrolase, partial [Stackebrandtia sp.]
AVYRSVEHGFAMVWASRTGTLTVADGYGRVLAEEQSGRGEGFTEVVAVVPEGPGSTVYTSLGDWFAWLCLALTLAGTAATLRRTSRPRSTVGTADQVGDN